MTIYKGTNSEVKANKPERNVTSKTHLFVASANTAWFNIFLHRAAGLVPVMSATTLDVPTSTPILSNKGLSIKGHRISAAFSMTVALGRTV